MDCTAMSFDTLCQACGSIFDKEAISLLQELGDTSKPGQQRPHYTYKQLVFSAGQGCHFCNVILNSISVNEMRMQAEDQDTLQAYQATIREDSVQLITTVQKLPSGPIGLLVEGYHMHEETIFGGTIALSSIENYKIDNVLDSRINFTEKLRERTLLQINLWSSTCLTSHETCKHSWNLVSSQRRLPTRLLDVGTSQLPIRIQHSRGMPVETQYLTLSHCWGSLPLIRLLESSIEVYCQSIPFSSLPRTFQDAVELTRCLGFRYLWIDALCIIQDSEEDWQREVCLMCEVYAHSYINIAATTSRDGGDGLFYRQSDLKNMPCLLRVEGKEGQVDTFITHAEHPFYEMVEVPKRAPLGNRGWVLQERMLSPRVLHFAEDQVYWECCCDVAAEFLPSKSVNAIPTQKMSSSGLQDDLFLQSYRPKYYQDWRYIVHMYSGCQLTKKSDKLPAISGLARRICKQLGEVPSSYLAGLWMEELPRNLLWSFPKREQHAHQRYIERAPSWSWACMDGPILCSSGLDVWTNIYTHVLEAQTFHNGDPFGQTNSGYIRLQGPVFNFILSSTKEHLSLDDLVSGASFDNTSNPPCFPTNFIYWDDYAFVSEAKGNLFFFLVIQTGDFSADGLVLYPTKVDRGQFQRVGVIHNAKMQDPSTFLEMGKSTGVLDAALYQDADPERGFTIEVV